MSPFRGIVIPSPLRCDGTTKEHRPGGLSDGKWHHVAMTQVDNGIHLYLDGKLHSSHNCRMDLSIKSLDRFKIGFTNTDFPKPSWFKGQMKNVAVYDYAMTDALVKELYGAELERK